MTALPTGTFSGNVQNTRGTIGSSGVSNLNVTLRVEYETWLHALMKDLRFFNEKWMITKAIPRGQNERVYFRIRERSVARVFQLNEGGKAAAQPTFDRTLADPLAGATPAEDSELVGMTHNMSTVEGVIKRYGCIFRYTAVNKSVSIEDPVEWAVEEMGILAAEHMDAIVKGVFDAYAQDIYPKTTITAENDNDWTTADVFDYNYVLALEAYVIENNLRGPNGSDRIPVLLPVDAQVGLLANPQIAQLLRDTQALGSPMGAIFQKGFIGSLRCFDFFFSNRLVPQSVTKVDTTTFNMARGYMFTDEALACLSMEDPAYGTLPNGSGNNKASEAGRGWDEMPRPVSVIRTEPGSSGIADPFHQLGAVAAMYTAGFTILQPARLIRFMFAAGNTGVGVNKVGVNVTAPSGSRAQTTGHTGGGVGVTL